MPSIDHQPLAATSHQAVAAISTLLYCWTCPANFDNNLIRRISPQEKSAHNLCAVVNDDEQALRIVVPGEHTHIWQNNITCRDLNLQEVDHTYYYCVIIQIGFGAGPMSYIFMEGETYKLHCMHIEQLAKWCTGVGEWLIQNG